MAEALKTIVEKLKATKKIERMPLNESIITAYCEYLVKERGKAAIEKLAELPKPDLERAMAALITGNDKELNSLIGCPKTEDVMDNIERSDKDVEKIGRRDKRLS